MRRRFAREFAVVSDRRLGRQIEHFLSNPERDSAHQALQFVLVPKADDLLVLVAAHYREPLTERTECRSENCDIEKLERPKDVQQVVWHRSSAQSDAVLRHAPKPLEKARCLAAGELQTMTLVGYYQVPLDLLGPVRKWTPPYGFVVDDAYEWHPAGLSQAHLLRGPLALLRDRTCIFVERHHDNFNRDMPLDLRDPYMNDPQRAGNHDPVRLQMQNQHQTREGLPGAHAHGQQQAEQPHREMMEAKGKGGELMAPRLCEQAFRNRQIQLRRHSGLFWICAVVACGNRRSPRQIR